MSYKATGQIHFIYPEQVITEKFKKREFILVLADKPEYPQYVRFEFIQDKCDLLNTFQQGQNVDIEFNLNGRMHTDDDGNTKCYNCNQSWKISASQG